MGRAAMALATAASLTLLGCESDGPSGSPKGMLWTDALHDTDAQRVHAIAKAANGIGIGTFVVTYDTILPRPYTTPARTSVMPTSTALRNAAILRNYGRVVYNAVGWPRVPSRALPMGYTKDAIAREVGFALAAIPPHADILLCWEHSDPAAPQWVYEYAHALRDAGFTGKFYHNFIGGAMLSAARIPWGNVGALNAVSWGWGTGDVENWDGRTGIAPHLQHQAFVDASLNAWIWSPELVRQDIAPDAVALLTGKVQP